MSNHNNHRPPASLVEVYGPHAAFTYADGYWTSPDGMLSVAAR